ncbi:MAG: universal stress protein [Deltaproteobacteria bacterium]|nr:universal stress protein [Deltaproteobacteria bacterium]MBW1915802.1 universal stress protein [Deltaproteobacteria bacterium]
MFEHILVPTDFSEKSKKALEIAIKMTRYEDIHKVTLLHVIETIEGTEQDEFGDFYKKLRTRAEKNMLKMTGPFKNEADLIDTKIVYGKREAEIVKFAHENQMDLIVLSSHRIGEENAYNWATISYKVGILAQCPVMMVK